MPTFHKFEDIVAWQKARLLTRRPYELTSKKPFSGDFPLKDQLRRAATSAMLNIAEGFARRTDLDFARFLSQAHGSTAEVQAALYVAWDQRYLDQGTFDEIYALAGECSRMVQSLGAYLGSANGRKHSSAIFPLVKKPSRRRSGP